MSHSQTTQKASRPCPLVLELHGGLVDALIPALGGKGGRRERRHIRFTHTEELGASLAAAVVEELQREGVKRQSVVVALGTDFAKTKILSMPPLAPRDRQQVLDRKAASLCDVGPNEVAFVAHGLDGEDSPEPRWLVDAAPRGPLSALQMEFRRLGFPVREVVAARTAAFLAPRASMGSDAAHLVALFESEHCAIGVLRGERLCHLSVVPGGAHAHLTDPDAARGLIQELRSLDAFWRRASRGEAIERMAFGGIDPFVVERLTPGIRAALGAVPIVALDEPSEGADKPNSDGSLPIGGLDVQDVADRVDDEVVPLDARETNRIFSRLVGIGTARLDGADMRLALKPKVSSVVAVAVASAAVCAGVGFTIKEDLALRAAELDREAIWIEEQASDLEELEAFRSRAANAVGQLRLARSEVDQIASLGLPAGSLLAGVFAAFSDNVQLLNLGATQASSSSKGPTIRLRGVVTDAPGATARELVSLEQRLRAIPGVVSARVELPDIGGVAGSAIGDANAPLPFNALVGLSPRGHQGGSR